MSHELNHRRGNATKANLILSVWRVLLLICGSTTLNVAAQEVESNLQRYEFSAEKMGVPVSVIFYASDDAKAQEGIDSVWKKFDELNAVLSDWDQESEIIQVCRKTGETGDFVPVSDELRKALELSRLYCELTDGAFDSTVSPIVKLWRRSRLFKERPPASVLEPAKKKVGLDVWSIDERGVRAEKGVRFDVGGIAKGIVMDEVLELLQGQGIRSALINASGDLRMGDPPPGKKGWRVGISSLSEEPVFYREVANVGIASSGDANRYVEIDGTRYSHIIDPRSCEPLTRRCVSTVLAPTATTADALASALCVLGGEEASKIFERIRNNGLGDERELAPFEYMLYQVTDDATPPYDETNTSLYATEFFKENPSNEGENVKGTR